MFVNDTATGNVNFTLNNVTIPVNITNGRANCTFEVNLDPGDYELLVVYSGNSVFYGQRNSSVISVKVPVTPTARINTNSSLVVNSSVSIESLTNFNITSLGKQFELVEPMT
ncbi:hypothetical protein, partial [Mesomycoplasma ovipneumoniae]|uniref:hypothetical protein n=1 Tax=Mesomycoplasma ovipneumoniae TaxID=29562 RepID=UPI003CCA5F58